jgi:hypothetical protein
MWLQQADPTTQCDSDGPPGMPSPVTRDQPVLGMCQLNMHTTTCCSAATTSPWRACLLLDQSCAGQITAWTLQHCLESAAGITGRSPHPTKLEPSWKARKQYNTCIGLGPKGPSDSRAPASTCAGASAVILYWCPTGKWAADAIKHTIPH